ncbi:hypothetical protein GGR56DRAFT_662525 [Xylariaceae sp. FL0804]|nr:hypothetical protein GGR56DRAFT_662525 [Xylariaceae sp. FL0804]
MYSYYHPMPNSNSRKRPAPGSVPMPQPMSQAYNTPEQYPRWNGNNSGNIVDNPMNGVNTYGMMSSPTPGQFTQGPVTPSTALAKRGMNNALITANRAYTPQAIDSWPTFGEDKLTPNPNGGVVDENDNIELLEERAQREKREALAKRRQIPPFVQKLNSFLEQSKNTELIRWSDKGDSFIVLDEDEFAKTLIPELFKHNNYASFVRQLNMYGFHKKVGLSDNSMKASERKNKSPSEYYNPYFKRGHPNLLWLINKPKSSHNAKKGKKRGDEPEPESDEEAAPVEDTANHAFPQQYVPNRALPAPEPGPFPKQDLIAVRDQLTAMRQQQAKISNAITRLRGEHNQLYQQAVQFQTQHDRHENSINAILHFLANVFRKSLEEQGGTQNVNDLLASIIPNVQLPPQGQGNVVDLGDWEQQQVSARSNAVGTPKRAQRLLPPIPANQGGSSTPSSANAPPAPQPDYSSHQQPEQVGQVTELYDTPPDAAGTPAFLKQDLESNPQEGMLRFIQDANTNAGKSGTTPIDLSGVAANTSPKLTNDQRIRMLNIMSGGQGSTASTPAPAATASSTPGPTASQTRADLGSSDGTNMAAPNGSLSLPLSGLGLPPSMQSISQTSNKLEQLQQLQSEQSQKLGDLSDLLGPLSPSGRIPGLDEASGSYFPDEVDLMNQWIEPSVYAADGSGAEPNAYAADGSGADFDFNSSAFADGANLDWNTEGVDFGPMDGADHGLIPNTSNAQTPSSAGTEEILRDDLDASPGRATKRQRKA